MDAEERNDAATRREGARTAARELVAMGVAVVVAALLLYALGIGCPIKFFTGVSCPGCGLTRAWLEALQLDFASALAYHPLFWLVPPAFAVAVARTYMGGGKVSLALLVAMLAALVILWAVRMAMPNDLALFVAGAGEGDVVNVSAPVWASWLTHLFEG